MPFRTLALCSPEQSSSAPSQVRPGPRSINRPLVSNEEVTRRVSLPAALDKAIEARRDVTGESRDEVIVSLLRTALRGKEEEAPVGEPIDLDALCEAAIRLSEISRDHRAWLSEHHAALDETHRAASGAVTDLREFASTTREVRSGLADVLCAVESAAEKQRATIAHALRDATGKAQEQLDRAQMQVASAQAQISAFEDARSLHLEGLNGHIERYRRILRLTPTLAVSFVGVACVIAVVTSLFFVPTFQKFSEDEFVQSQIAPVIQEEIKKSFEMLRTENETQTKAFFELENARFEKFAVHYRKHIDSLKGDKATLANEHQKLIRAYNSIAEANTEWKKHAAALESENAKLQKSSIDKLWSSFNLSGSTKLFLFILLVPLFFLGVRRLSEWRR